MSSRQKNSCSRVIHLPCNGADLCKTEINGYYFIGQYPICYTGHIVGHVGLHRKEMSLAYVQKRVIIASSGKLL